MDTVIARQHPHDATQLQWRRESADGDVRLGEGGFAELAQTCASARLLWLVPTEDVLLTEVRIANRRELRRAAPYALEDELAEDIDTLHFAYARAVGNNPVPVAVVARHRLDGWLDRLTEHGLRPQALIPDVLALPLTASHISILLEGGRGLVRTGVTRGLAVDADTLEALLEAELQSTDTAPAGLDVWRCADDHTRIPQLDVPLEEHPCPGNLLALIPPGWGRQPPLNLLQGDFRPRRPARQHAPWWVAAALAAAWLLLAFTQDVLHHRQLLNLKTEYQEAIRRIYFETFPDAVRAPDPRLLMEQRLTALKTEGDVRDGSFLMLLEAVAAAITDPNAARILSLRFRDGRLDAELDAASADVLEQIKQTVEHAGFRANLQSVATQGERVTGRINVEQPQ